MARLSQNPSDKRGAEGVVRDKPVAALHATNMLCDGAVCKQDHTPEARKDLVRMRERPLFTAAFVFSSPSFVPSLAAFMNFCICKKRGKCEKWHRR